MVRYYAMERRKGFDWESAAWNDNDPKIRQYAVKNLSLKALDNYIMHTRDTEMKEIAIARHKKVIEDQKRKTNKS